MNKARQLRVKQCIDEEVKLRKYSADERVYILYTELRSFEKSEMINKRSKSE